MNIYYSANGVRGDIGLPSAYLEKCRAEDLAELVASDYWRNRPSEIPSVVTLVHLQDVDGRDCGLFEVRRNLRPVFTATPLGAAEIGGTVGVSLPATLPKASANN